jgi:transmembrane sensor
LGAAPYRGRDGLRADRAFADWLQQSPDHGKAFDRAMASWAMLEDPRFEPEILALRSEALDALHAVRAAAAPLALFRPHAYGAGRRDLALVVGAGIWLWLRPTIMRPARRAARGGAGGWLATGDGCADQRDRRLPCRWAASGAGTGTRHLHRGQGPAASFSVASHGSLVVATGTQFGVEWLGDQTRVVLYEGHVAILRNRATG